MYMMLNKNLNLDYVVGLVDGEGSFTVYIRNPDKISEVKRRVTVEPKFYLKLNEDDREILVKLKEFFGCGQVYFQKDNRPNHKDCYRYEVFRKEDLLETIIPFFKKHTLQFPTKKKDFEIFCQLMEDIQNKKHLTTRGLHKMYLTKQKMH